LALVDRDHPDLSLKTQCDLLSLNRTHLYYQPLPTSPEELAVKRRIDELYTACPFYGSRKITVLLQQEMTINRKTVQRHMREMGIAGIVPGPNTSKQAAEHRVFPYLLRHVTAGFPNHIWGIDGRPFGRLVNVSCGTTHHQGCASLPWRSKGPSTLGSVSFQGT
jgi:putative transposase